MTIKKYINALFSRNYIKKLHKDNKKSNVWSLWFIVNTLMVVFIMIYLQLSVGLFTMFSDFNAQEFLDDTPAFTLKLENGIFSTDLPEPFVKNIIDDEGEKLDIIIDTQNLEYSEENIIKADPGVYIFAEKLIIKDVDELNIINFSEFELNNFEITKDSLMQFLDKVFKYFNIIFFLGVFIGLWLFLNIFRLLTALWWALLAFISSKMTDHGDWITFYDCYLLILSYYWVPLVIELLLYAVGVGKIPLSTFAIMTIIIALTFTKIDKEKRK